MRKDYALLDQKIKNAYIEEIKKEKGQIPSEAHIAEICGTTQATVSKHLSNTNLDELIRPFKIFGNDVLLGLRNRASKGDAQAAKLFFALVFDWNEKQEIKGELKVKAEVKVMTMEEIIKKYKKAIDEIKK
jgi:hypothetical protein